jgi:hypothetical protein
LEEENWESHDKKWATSHRRQRRRGMKMKKTKAKLCEMVDSPNIPLHSEIFLGLISLPHIKNIYYTCCFVLKCCPGLVIWLPKFASCGLGYRLGSM